MREKKDELFITVLYRPCQWFTINIKSSLKKNLIKNKYKSCNTYNVVYPIESISVTIKFNEVKYDIIYCWFNKKKLVYPKKKKGLTHDTRVVYLNI